MKIFDLSPEITEEIAVFPGDTSFQVKHLMDMSRGDHLGLTSVTTTLHLGSHTDGPIHYKKNGKGIGERSLNYYIGPCQVLEVTKVTGPRIGLNDLPQGFAPKQKRILFKTNSYPDPKKWNKDFLALSAEVIEFLALHGVLLVGIDTPSLDPAEDQKLECHHMVAKHDLGILEGIDLSRVPEGEYFLMAAPLKITKGDASPVRALLIDGPDWRQLGEVEKIIEDEKK